ncbi:MAG: endolytic transglycosylase MltG [Ilumatobacteraceae bacterium]|nr:endolytic transglycosylase MltG [Ilumatobacteraceae bacterium]
MSNSTGDPLIDKESDVLGGVNELAADWEQDPWDIEPVVSLDDVGVTPTLVPKSFRLLVRAVFLASLALVLVVGLAGLWFVRQINPGGVASVPGNFTINEGDTLTSVTERLENDGIIVNAGVFRWYVARKGGIVLLPGYYSLKPHDTAGNIIRALNTPPAQTFVKVTFPEGFTIDQMAERLGLKVPYLSTEDFTLAAADKTIRSEFQPDDVTSLEGLLFPDTYQVSGDDDETRVIKRMIQLMERVGRQEKINESQSRVGYSAYKVLIIASMIEREAKVPQDRAKIARVIYNRLALGMPLEIDATLLYGTDPQATFADLKAVDGPYNTYARKGLPPTPIANPGRASISAALAPAPDPPLSDAICQGAPRGTKCQYLYYVLADAEGRHVFAATYNQHLANVEKARVAGLLK